MENFTKDCRGVALLICGMATIHSHNHDNSQVFRFRIILSHTAPFTCRSPCSSRTLCCATMRPADLKTNLTPRGHPNPGKRNMVLMPLKTVINPLQACTDRESDSVQGSAFGPDRLQPRGSFSCGERTSEPPFEGFKWFKCNPPPPGFRLSLCA